MKNFILKNKFFVPLFLWLLYSLATIIIFAFGPLDYGISNPVKLYSFLILAHISVILGYLKGYRKFKNLKFEENRLKWIKLKTLNTISWIVFFSIILTFYRDFSSGIEINFDDPLRAREMYTGERSGGFLGYLSAILSVFNAPFLVLGIINFKRVNTFSKIILVLLIFILLYGSIAGASRHGLMFLIIVAFFSFLALKFSNQLKTSFKKIVILGSFVIFIFLSYSSFLAINRYEKPVDDYIEFMSVNRNFEFKKDNIFVPNLKGNFQIINAGILSGYFYFTHAYKGLSNSLDLPFIGTTFFFGHSDFAIRNLARIFGDHVLNYSYHYRLINENLHVKNHWITAYSWLASDFTFFGVIIILYFFASLLSSSWIKIIQSPTIISCAMFAWIIYFFFQINITFVPADLGAFISFWGTILIYKFKLNYKK